MSVIRWANCRSRWVPRAFVCVLALAAVLAPASARTATTPAVPSEVSSASAPAPVVPPETAADVDTVLRLLAQPGVADALAARLAASRPATPASPAAVEPPAATDTAAADTDPSPLEDVDLWASHRREHLARAFAGLPALPADLAAAGARFVAAAVEHGSLRLAAELMLLLAGGYGAAQLARRIVAVRRASGADATELAIAAGEKLVPVAAFALTVMLLFFVVQWGPLLSALLMPWLVLCAAVPLASALADLATGPIADDDGRRRFWRQETRRLALVALADWASLRTLGNLDLTRDGRMLVSFGFGAVLLLLSLRCIWMGPRGDGDGAARRLGRVLLTFYLLLLAAAWSAGLAVLFWLGVYAIVVPALVRLAGGAARAIGHDGAAADDLRAIFAERGGRLVIVALAAGWIVYLVRAFPHSLPDGFAAAPIVTGAVRAVLILLAADLAWAVIRALITRRLAGAAPAGDPHGAAATSDRLQTLLPILRNLLGIAIAVIAVMMALSELGVDVAPLIASAGVFGIALGFGSQTLVKDVISGIFYMIDDAFRVGEYIQSGSYKGTVESFSIRSVKLRHHRGPIYTVPFGSLGAVQNMSRDWAIDKFTVSVAYDTDLAKVKRISKEIGAALKDDPEFGPLLIETVKLKGVEQFGDYGITLSFGMMLRPGGQQSMIRRRAFAMLKDAFADNGIRFASVPGLLVGPPRIVEGG